MVKVLGEALGVLHLLSSRVLPTSLLRKYERRKTKDKQILCVDMIHIFGEDVFG